MQAGRQAGRQSGKVHAYRQASQSAKHSARQLASSSSSMRRTVGQPNKGAQLAGRPLGGRGLAALRGRLRLGSSSGRAGGGGSSVVAAGCGRAPQQRDGTRLRSLGICRTAAAAAGGACSAQGRHQLLQGLKGWVGCQAPGNVHAPGNNAGQRQEGKRGEDVWQAGICIRRACQAGRTGPSAQLRGQALGHCNLNLQGH